MNYKKIFFAFVFCLLQFHLSAQIKTIIPGTMVGNTGQTFTVQKSTSETTYGYIKFSLASLPPNAVIKKAILRLVVGYGSTSDWLVVMGECVECGGGQAISNKILEVFAKDTPVELISRNEATFPQMLMDRMKAGSITIKISPKENNANFTFYGTPAVRPDNWEYSSEPRLIIYYTTNIKPASWAGYKANAQHTSCSPGEYGPENSYPKENSLIVKTIFDNSSVTIHSATLDKGQLYFTTAAGKLYAADGYTAKLKDVVTMASPALQPTMTGDGYYYTTVTDGIIPVKLDSGIKESQIANTDMRTSPVTGRDGSLYLCQGTTLKAYAPPPVRQLLWQYNFNTPDIFSAPSLSTDDSFVYVASCVKADKTGKLSRTSVLDKRQFTNNVAFDITGTDQQLAAPVVDINNNVFQLDGLSSGSNLFIYDKSLRLRATIKTNGRKISPPVCAGTSTYVVLDNQWLVQYAGPVSTDTIAITNGVRFMNTDKDDNVYVLDNKNIFHIYSFSGGHKELAQVNVNEKTGTNLDYKDMLVGPDGVAYLYSSSRIYSIVPTQFTVGNYEVAGAEMHEDYTYRAGTIIFKNDNSIKKSNTFTSASTITVKENVNFESTSTSRLQARTGITLQKNTHVKKGAVVSCKVGR